MRKIFITMKFGVDMPQTVEEAQELDKKNGYTFWQDAIKKEYNNVKRRVV